MCTICREDSQSQDQPSWNQIDASKNLFAHQNGTVENNVHIIIRKLGKYNLSLWYLQKVSPIAKQNTGNSYEESIQKRCLFDQLK